jgi:hypothetical protein
MTDVEPVAGQLSRLAVPGERLGWVFRDRNLYRRRFLEPPPVPEMVSPVYAQRVAVHQAQMAKRILLTLGIGGGFAFLLSCCGSVASSGSEGAGTGVIVFGLLVGLAAAGGAILPWVVYNNAKGALEREQRRVQEAYRQAMAYWDARRVAYNQHQQAGVDQMFEWGAATPAPGTRRVDIVGGTSWGWEALLTVFGGSLLSTRGAVMLVDFTGEALCGELLSLAEETRRTVRLTALPSQLDQVNLATGLETRELVDSLVESMYGDRESGSRAERSQDTMLLTELCEVLGDNITVARIIAGVRVLTDRSGEPALSPVEVVRVLNLMPDEARRQAHTHLRRIEGFLRPLESMGSSAVELPTVDLSCLVADRDGRSAQNELLKDLIVQWLIRQVGHAKVQRGSIVVLGADEVHHQHIERLTTVCERSGVRLVLFFQHLREQTQRLLGGGEVCFMRLGNHQEAQQAAEFIGRQHKFVLSQLTRTLGGNETHTVADTEGYAETEGYSVTKGGSSGHSAGRGHSGSNWSRTRNWSHTRNWSQTLSTATGTNWSDAASAQRVYEFAVEPRVLQDLPDYALLLVKGEGRGSVVQAVECDPAITMLPRMTMAALDYVPLPPPQEAVIPVSGPPEQVTVSRPAPIAPTPASPGQAASHVLPGWGNAGAPGQFAPPQYQPQPHYPAPQQPHYPPPQQPQYPPQQPPYPQERGWTPQ